ncbi:LptF/LptG family permease [Desulfovibrio sp. OttesenSCG-928-G15]|nr:LptF/LptG family permease [Desulfovibrio sp. OttesenSCG-928-G15]
MTLLTRYLVRQNLFLVFTILLIGTGLYLLTDVFERLDHFLESEAGPVLMFSYFAVKLPMIISQILPAVFIIAVVVQMNFLRRSNELTALTAGGIAPGVLVRSILLYGLAWAVGQFAFAQLIGVEGERTANRIWQEDVKGRTAEEMSISGLWFTEKNKVIHVGKAYPGKQMGENILVYDLDGTGIEIKEIIKAKRFQLEKQGWRLEEGESLKPAEYALSNFDSLLLPLEQDLKVFQITTKTGAKPSELSLGELRDTIARLEASGSNVELLRTAWHGKMSYAFSLVIMGLLALIISRLTPSIYKAIFLSLIVVFFYYGINTFCMSMGEKGLVAPVIGAWFANVFFFGAGILWISLPALRKKYFRSA